MNWEETILFLQGKPEYDFLVEKSYFDQDIDLNIKRFQKSVEFEKTLEILNKFKPEARKILDIGSGNGISAINFALRGFVVDAVEPDTSKLIGAGAIELLKEKYKLNNITIHTKFAEDIEFPEASFDVVYIRQAMHHANNLHKFIGECARVLKPGGMLLTIRDHVIFNEVDKKWFLQEHPLQKFYGGENAFTIAEYRKAMEFAGLEIKNMMKFYDSEINYFPITKAEVLEKKERFRSNRIQSLKRRIGWLGNISFIQKIMFNYLEKKGIVALDEKKIPGRMYSFIAIKK